MPKKPNGAMSSGTGKKPEPKEAPVRYKSAAELLADLLPQLQALAPSMRGRGKDGTWRKLYLHTLGHCANITIAAQIAGVTTAAVRLARADREFDAAEKEAMTKGVDLIEASAFKSAVYGDMEPIYHQGILCGHVLKYSDAMRALLLKGRRPEVYRDKIEATGTIEHTHMTMEEFQRRLKEAQE